MIASKKIRWQERTTESQRGERLCADCRYLTADQSMDNPLERMAVCRLGPPTTIALPMQQGIGLLTSLPSITDPDKQWCFQYERYGTDS